MSGLSRQKILLLTPQLPYPPEQGTSLRNFHIVRGLSQFHEVHLLSFLEPAQEQLVRHSPLNELCARVETVPAPERTLRQRLQRLVTDRSPDMAHRLQSAAFESALRKILQQGAFDIVQIEGIELAANIPLIRRLSPDSTVVFDDHNAEAELQRRMFVTDVGNPRRWIAAAYSYIQWRRLRRFERWACLAADGVSVVSEADSVHLHKLAPSLEVTVVPNSIDVDRYRDLPRDEATNYDLLFIGKMDYRPNVDAVLWFGSEIWPLIHKQRPNLTWAIVGKEPHRRLQPLAQEPGIYVTGTVPEIEPYLAGACVYVMPFRIGSGTRLKLIEALAAGVPVVSTRVGAEGYPLTHDRHLLLADEPAVFASAVLRLLEDEGQRQKLSAAGQSFAAQYDWRRVVPAFNELYSRILPG